MDIVEKHLEAFCVVGIATDTTNTKESDPDTAQIPDLWQQFFSDNIESQIKARFENGNLFGVYSNYEDSGEKSYRLLAGRQVSSLQNVPQQLAGIEVPESDYLVFSDEGEMPEIIYSMWQAIRDYFSNNGQYQRKYSFDFECYSNDDSSRVDIYIAIES